MVQDIEQFGAKSQIPIFPNSGAFQERAIQIYQARTVEPLSRKIAERAKCLLGKAVRVEPHSNCAEDRVVVAGRLADTIHRHSWIVWGIVRAGNSID